MQDLSYSNIKEIIINQHENIEEVIPIYFNEKFSNYLKEKTDVYEIKLEEILGFKSSKLEKILKNKLKNIQQNNTLLTLEAAFQRLQQEEKSWLQAFLRFVSRVFLLREQEKLVNEILNDLPEEMCTALQDAIKAEENQIIKDLDSSGDIIGLTEEKSLESTAQLGEAVHEVKKYKNDEGKLFFIKDVTYGFKRMMYKLLTGIENEGMREAIGSAFYHAMGLSNSAEVGVIKDTRNKAIKIFSKAVGEENDKICSLGQFLKGWNFDVSKADENQKIAQPKDWLNNILDLKKEIIKAHAVSMLIGNRDLKDDNIMIIKKADGTLHCAPIDFGLSCHKVTTLK